MVFEVTPTMLSNSCLSMQGNEEEVLVNGSQVVEQDIVDSVVHAEQRYHRIAHEDVELTSQSLPLGVHPESATLSQDCVYTPEDASVSRCQTGGGAQQDTWQENILEEDTPTHHPQDYSDRLVQASGEIQALEDELKRQSDHFQLHVHQLDQYYRGTYAEYQTALDAAQSKIQILERQYNGEHDRRQKAEGLLEIGRRELQEAQVYLEKSDTMSGHDIVELVKAVNAEIFQLAASISESAPRQEHIHCPGPSSESVQDLIGANFLAVLRIESLPNWDAEILLQTAVQTALVKIVQRWNMFFTVNGAQGGLISAYKNIRNSSPQSVSSRWRALVYSRHKYMDPVAALEKLRLLLHTTLTTVITYLGYSMPQDGILDLTPLAEAAIKADRAAVEGVLSQSMVFACIDGGKAFDKQTMADADGGRGSAEKKGRTVACCIEAGVYCSIRGDTGAFISQQWILKPRVLLEDAFYDQ